MKNYDDYVHIDPDRDNQLCEAAWKRQNEERAEARTAEELEQFKWIDRYEAALIAFEEGNPQEWIKLEKALGIVWKDN
jgi:hypothetical protein